LARALADGLWRELVLTPKPGLVDLEDAGSHPDLSFEIMERSVRWVGAHLAEVARAAARGEPLAAQVERARDAERRLRARFGTNTHKGALFLGGAAILACARAPDEGEAAFREALRAVAQDLRPLLAPEPTHGAAARARFGVGGILAEVGAGLPAVFEVALPAWRRARARGETGDAPAFRMLAGLMRSVEDTTALHRCGAAGLATLREDGAGLERALDAGDEVAFLRGRNAAWRARGLTMGGVADLLGVACGWLAHRGELEGAITHQPPCGQLSPRPVGWGRRPMVTGGARRVQRDER
jgi:triphosphoribosyl-dephospho-CoA synthase